MKTDSPCKTTTRDNSYPEDRQNSLSCKTPSRRPRCNRPPPWDKLLATTLDSPLTLYLASWLPQPRREITLTTSPTPNPPNHLRYLASQPTLESQRPLCSLVLLPLDVSAPPPKAATFPPGLPPISELVQDTRNWKKGLHKNRGGATLNSSSDSNSPLNASMPPPSPTLPLI